MSTSVRRFLGLSYSSSDISFRPLLYLSLESNHLDSEPKLTLDKEEIEFLIESGGTATAELTATLENAEGDLTWTVSEDSGITIIGEGNTRTITVTKAVENATITVSYGPVKVTCKITVKEKGTLISFTIDAMMDTYECTAEDWMTWGEWIESEYNTEGFYASGESIIIPNRKDGNYE